MEKSMSQLENKNPKEMTLLEASSKMKDSVRIFQDINAKANIISINAAIEGARLRGKLASFSIVAQAIHAQSIKNGELSEKLEVLVRKIQDVALRSTAVRFYELAEDLIDKIDRNLFERNCDVQAWATFEAIVDCTTEFSEMDPIAFSEQEKTSVALATAKALLEKLVNIYEVYSDVFLLNCEGMVVCAAKNQDSVGSVWKAQPWFTEAMTGKMNVSDMQFCEATGGNSVFYSAPVVNPDGKVIGVLTSRFNWKFAQEMIDHAGFDSDVRAYFIDESGTVLGSTDSIGIMRDSLDWLDTGRSAMKGYCGYGIERDRNGSAIAVGYARTKGYNAYRGKRWSAIVVTRLKTQDILHLEHRADQRSEDCPSGIKAQNHDLVIESEKANVQLQYTMKEINTLVSEVNINNREAKLLAINASIQSGIAGTEGESFSIIAEEIARLAKKSLEFVDSINHTAKELRKVVEDTVSTRLSDAANDAVDKVDRNLFERFCDVQAWTTFQQFTDVIQGGAGEESASSLLSRLHKIYEVYHDIYLLNVTGQIVAAAVNRSLIGQNQANRPWFRDAVAGKVHYSDVYSSSSVSAPTVAFAAPVCGPNGEVIGVLTTRLNCTFLNDILKAVIVDSLSKVYLVNQLGAVMGSATGKGVLNENFSHLKACQLLVETRHGHTVEVDSKDGKQYSIGFCRGAGYNAYPGKSWSVLIQRLLEAPLVESKTDSKNRTGQTPQPSVHLSVVA